MKILKSLKIFSEFETIDLETVKKKKEVRAVEFES